jgi:hypothetical protein
VVYGNNPDLRQPGVGAVKSAYNNGTSGCSVTIWTGPYWTGPSLTLPQHTGYSDFLMDAGSNRWC